MSGEVSEIETAPLVAKQQSGEVGQAAEVAKQRWFSRQQSAAPDEARDTVRAAHASIGRAIKT